MATGYIYKIVNPEGRIYIGATLNYKSRMNSYKSEAKHCYTKSPIHSSMNLYGFDAHDISIITSVNNCNRLFLDELERHYIRLYCSFYDWNRGGMNMTTGGGKGANRSILYEFKKLTAMDLQGNVVGTFNGILAAEKFCNGDRKNISSSALNKRHLAYGYIWSYDDNPEVLKVKYNRYKHWIDNRSQINKIHSQRAAILKRKKIIDTNTGIIYNSIIDVTNEFGMGKKHLQSKLSNYINNNTSFKYYNIGND